MPTATLTSPSVQTYTAGGRTIWTGEPGTRYFNDSGKVLYQLICSGLNTCGICYQYIYQIGSPWPIPFHHHCRCEQRAIRRGAEAEHDFADFRQIIDDLPENQRGKVVGRANLQLVDAGVVTWQDVVTASRIRDLREVVDRMGLKVADLVRAGIKPKIAEDAFAAVHKAEHEHAARQRKELADRLLGAGMHADKLVAALGKGLAGRVTVAEQAGSVLKSGRQLGPAWEKQRLTVPGDLARVLAGQTAGRPLIVARPKPVSAAVPEKPAARTLRAPGEFETHADVVEWAKRVFPNAQAGVDDIPVESWNVIAKEIEANLKLYPGIGPRLKYFGSDFDWEGQFKNSIAVADPVDGARLHFNPNHWDNLKYLDGTLMDGVNTGFHPARVDGAGPAYYATHEVGHLVDADLRATDVARWRALHRIYYDAPTRTLDTVKAGQVSQYAATNRSEAFAESFAAAKWQAEQYLSAGVKQFMKAIAP